MLIERDTPPSDHTFGNVMQTFDADTFRGHVVRFSASVRTELAGPADRAQLWMRADRPNKQFGFFANMKDRPIRAPQWESFEIIGIDGEDYVIEKR